MKRAQAAQGILLFVLVAALMGFTLFTFSEDVTDVTGHDVFIQSGSSPTVINVTINSTFGTNLTSENITLYWNATDPENDPLYNITTWIMNSDFTLLNLPFENNTNATNSAVDYSPYRNNGTIVGSITQVAGRYGFAYDFNKSGSANITGSMPTISSNRFTLSFWYNSSDTSVSGGVPVALATVSGGNGPVFSSFSLGRPGCQVQFGLSGVNVQASSAPTAGLFHNVVCLYDPAASLIRLYIDGTEVTNASHSGTPVSTTGYSVGFHIGNTLLGAFNGTIDQVNVWNYTFTPQQVVLLNKSPEMNVIHASMLNTSQTWSACVTPNDGSQDGATVCSNQLAIFSPNMPPSVINVTLNSTFGTNGTNENLTVYWNSSDIDNHSIINITDWRVNGNSIAPLYMPFEGGSNTTFTRVYSSYQHNVTVNNAVWNATGGYDGHGAYQFGSPDSYINITGFAGTIDVNWTVMVWFKVKEFYNSQCLVCWGNEAVGQRRSLFIHNNIAPPSVANQKLYSSSYASNTIATTTLNTDTWYHGTVTMNFTGQTNLYLNGVLDGSGTNTLVPISGSAGAVAIDGLGEQFNGTIDEVRIYNRILSPEQITLIYQNKTNIISSQETAIGQNWSAAVTPNDGTQDGVTVLSNNVTISNVLPTIVNLRINTTSGTNSTTDNITAFFTQSDVDSNAVVNVTDWRVNGRSIAVVNFPFESHSNAANNATDYSTTNRNASVSGALFNASGGFDGKGAYQFDGTNDFIIVSGETISTANNITIMAWFKANVFSGLQDVISTWPSGLNEPIRIYFDGSVVKCYTEVAGTGNFVTVISSPTTGQWYHVACTWDTSINNLTGYFNGVRIGAVNNSGADKSNTNFVVGARGDSAGEFWNGFIDDVRWYNRSLSPAQIDLVYQNKSHIISSQETTRGEIWSAAVTPNDGMQDGVTALSNNIAILNALPQITSIRVNTTFGTNLTTENITAHFTQSDEDDVSITNITDWRINGRSFAVFNVPFETNGTRNASDYSTYAYHASAIGATPVWNATGGHDGRGAYSCDSAGDEIRFPDAPQLDGFTNMTISLWVNPRSSQGANNELFGKHTASLTGWVLEASGANTNYLFAFFVGGTCYGCATASTLTANQWQHFVVLRNGTNIIHYVDGVQTASGTGSAGPIDDSTADLYVCDSGVQLDRTFNGMVDDIKIFNRTLSYEQILLLNASHANVISEKETTRGEIWSATVTPNDGIQDGVTVLSNNVTILNTPPQITTIRINTTFGTNLTTENITAFFTQSDADADNITIITDWRVNGRSIALLNMPFENHSNSASNATDYSTHNHTGGVTGALFNATGGYDGRGAYQFKRTNSIITTGNLGSLNNFTISLWLKRNTAGIREFFFGTQNVGIGQYIFTYFGDVGTARQDHLEFAFHTSATDYRYRYTDIAITDTNWHYIVFQRSGNDSKIWVDGINRSLSDHITAGDASGTINTNAQYFIGTLYNGDLNAENFNGSLDNIVVFNRTLSDEEISLLYQNKSHIISEKETRAGEVWSLAVTPNDGLQDGATVFTTLPNTLALWNFENNTFDSSGNSYGLTTVGSAGFNTTPTPIPQGSYVADKFAAGSYFNGSSASLREAFGNLSNFTMEYYVYFNETPLFDTMVRWQNPTQVMDVIVGSSGADPFGISFRRFEGGSVEISTSATLTKNTWYHVAVTLNGTEGKIYVDGVERASGLVGTQIPSPTLFIVGSDTNSFVHGAMDELRISNVVKTSFPTRDATSVISNTVTINNRFNITTIFPNATNQTQPIGGDDNNVSISIRGINNTFNVTAINLEAPALTFTWLVNGVQRFVETITGFFSSVFRFLFTVQGQYNVTVIVNDSTVNDTFTFFTNVECVEPFDNLTVTNSTLFCPGTFNMRNGIRVNAASIVITCNQTLFNGSTNSGRAINVTRSSNVSIIGCSIQRYDDGIFISSSPNITAINNTLNEIQNDAFDFTNATSFTAITNNISRANIGFRGTNSLNILAVRNEVRNSTSTNAALFLTGVNASTVANNSVFRTILFTSSAGNNIFQNTITNAAEGISLSPAENNNVTNNLIINTTQYGIRFFGTTSNGNVLRNNTILNTTGSDPLGDVQATQVNTNTIIFENGVNELRYENVRIRINRLASFAINNSIVAKNDTFETNMNFTANVSFVAACNAELFNNSGFFTTIQSASSGATLCSSSKCQNRVCANNIMNFSANLSTVFANVVPNITTIYPNATNQTQPISEQDNNVSISIRGINQTFNVTAIDADAPFLTFTWLVNGIQRFTETIASGLSSIFNFIFNVQGQYNITVVVNDSTHNDTFTFFTNIECVEPTNGMNVVNSTVFCPGTYNLADGIDIGLSNILIQCNQTIFNGSLITDSRGIEISNFHNVTIQSCVVSNYYDGLYLAVSQNHTLSNIVSFTNNNSGILFDSSVRGTTLTNITSFNNMRDGITLQSSSSGNRLSGINTSSNVNNGITLSSSSSNNLSNVISSNNSGNGISLSSSSSANVLSNVTASGNNRGIIATSGPNVFLNITASSNIIEGILLTSSSNNLTSVITSSNGGTGIIFGGGSSNRLSSSRSSSNNIGIDVSTSVTFIDINVSSNTLGGVFLQSSGSTLTNITGNANSIDIRTDSSSNTNTLHVVSGQNLLSYRSKFINVTDLDNLFVNNSIVAVNSSAEPQMNASANVSFAVSSCSVELFTFPNFTTTIESARAGATFCATCSARVCANNVLNFTTSSFSTIFANVVPNITIVGPNATNLTQPINQNDTNFSIVVEAGTNRTFNITAIDSDASVLTFRWFVNGVETFVGIISQAFNSLFSYVFSSLGFFNITAVVNDSSSNDTFTFFVFSNDTILPFFNQTPGSFSIQFGTPLSVQINGTDSFNFSRYAVNDTTNFFINATTGAFTNATGLLPRVYSLNITINDTSNNKNSTVFNITVADIVPPSFNQTLQNIARTVGSSIFLDVNASDNVAIDTYFINDNVNFTINRTSGVLQNNVTLSIRTYTLNISVNDTSNNINSSIITVTISAAPTVSSESAGGDEHTPGGPTYAFDIRFACNAWTDCVNGIQTRVCTDQSGYSRPRTESQACGEPSKEEAPAVPEVVELPVTKPTKEEGIVLQPRTIQILQTVGAFSGILLAIILLIAFISTRMKATVLVAPPHRIPSTIALPPRVKMPYQPIAKPEIHPVQQPPRIQQPKITIHKEISKPVISQPEVAVPKQTPELKTPTSYKEALKQYRQSFARYLAMSPEERLAFKPTLEALRQRVLGGK